MSKNGKSKLSANEKSKIEKEYKEKRKILNDLLNEAFMMEENL